MFSVFFLFFVLGIVWIFMGLRARPQTYYRHLPTGLEEKIRSACKNEGKSGAWDSRRSHGSRRTAAVGPKTLNGFRTTTAGGHRGVYKYDVCGLRFRRTKWRGVAAGRKSITRRGVKRPPRSCCGLARGEKQVDFEFTATNPARCTAFRGKLRIPRGRARRRTFSALAGRSASLEVSDDPISSPIARHAFDVFAVAHTPPPRRKDVPSSLRGFTQRDRRRTGRACGIGRTVRILGNRRVTCLSEYVEDPYTNSNETLRNERSP